MKEKSHKGQRHKGSAYCNPSKQAGDGEDRRTAQYRREIDRANAEIAGGFTAQSRT